MRRREALGLLSLLPAGALVGLAGCSREQPYQQIEGATMGTRYLEVQAARNAGLFPQTIDPAREVIVKYGLTCLTDPWGTAYYYGVNNQGKGFSVFSLGPNGQAGGDDDIVATQALGALSGQSVVPQVFAAAWPLSVK